MTYPLALLLTLVIELPIVLGLAGRRAVPTAVALNLVTHPLLWLAMLRFGVGLWTAEAAVVAAEAIGYRFVAGLTAGRAAGISFLANGLSLAIGLALSSWW